EDGSERFDLIDQSRFADPTEAFEASEMAAIVWDAAASLSASEYTLLDLHVRRELSGPEIAVELGTSANSVYVRINRLKKSMERAVTALFMLRRGHEYCDVLAAELAAMDADELTLPVKTFIERHMANCDTCGDTVTRIPPPIAV